MKRVVAYLVSLLELWRHLNKFIIIWWKLCHKNVHMLYQNPKNKILTDKGMSIFHKLLNSVTANKQVVYNVSV